VHIPSYPPALPFSGLIFIMMDTSHVSFCPYRASINPHNPQWHSVQVTEHTEPLTFARKPQFTKYTQPVTFTGGKKDLELLEACKQKSGMLVSYSSIYLRTHTAVLMYFTSRRPGQRYVWRGSSFDKTNSSLLVLAGDSAKYLDSDPNSSEDGNANEHENGNESKNSEIVEGPVASASISPVQDNSDEEVPAKEEHSIPPSDLANSEETVNASLAAEETPSSSSHTETQENIPGM